MIHKSQLFLTLVLLPALASAEDTLKTVLARMKADEATAISYKEKRTLKMLSEDWHGTGTLYAAPPHTMIKEQRSPEVEIMGIEGKQAYYFQQDNNQRYQTELDENELHAVAFNELMNDDLSTLQKLYDISLTTPAGHWVLTLVAKNQKTDNGKQPAKIIMQGLADQPANNVTVIQADGDKSEFTLSPATKGVAAQNNIEKLLKHIKG
jgi:outer membrane lipoprotein-sorting protein